MGLAGFCRNYLSNRIEEASVGSGEELRTDAAREAIYGRPYSRRWQRRSRPDLQ
ncbi:DUF1244 domain-containing protein [Sphingomonas sp. GCM10030256]|uniref:DUF1244 domain-containing protein n=1 Tax=Sphingomonas sp. GCM10030256 TaxID=3273427 RepID=UPI00360856D9